MHNGKDYEFNIRAKKMDYPQAVVWSEISIQNFAITGLVVKKNPKKGEIYLRFYKVISICDQIYESQRQTIEIVFPIDGVKKSENGKVVFRKAITLFATCGDLNQPIATLKLEFDIDETFQLVPKGTSGSSDCISYIQIGIEKGQPQLMFQGYIIDNPPQKLLNIFTG